MTPLIPNRLYTRYPLDLWLEGFFKKPPEIEKYDFPLPFVDDFCITRAYLKGIEQLVIFQNGIGFHFYLCYIKTNISFILVNPIHKEFV